MGELDDDLRLRISRTLKQQLEARAAKEDVTVGHLVRRAIDVALTASVDDSLWRPGWRPYGAGDDAAQRWPRTRPSAGGDGGAEPPRADGPVRLGRSTSPG